MVEPRGLGDIRVGMEITPLVKRPTASQLAAWVDMSGDHNPIHLDKNFAVSRGLPGVIVPGQLVLAFLGQMMAEWLGDGGELEKLSVRYKGLIFPDDTVTCRGVVTEKTCGRITLRVWAENPRGKTTVVGTAVVKALG